MPQEKKKRTPSEEQALQERNKARRAEAEARGLRPAKTA